MDVIIALSLLLFTVHKLLKEYIEKYALQHRKSMYYSCTVYQIYHYCQQLYTVYLLAGLRTAHLLVVLLQYLQLG